MGRILQDAPDCRMIRDLRGIGIRCSPRFEAVQVFRGDRAVAESVKEVIAARGRQTLHWSLGITHRRS
jgi:hypothetical protein